MTTAPRCWACRKPITEANRGPVFHSEGRPGRGCWAGTRSRSISWCLPCYAESLRLHYESRTADWEELQADWKELQAARAAAKAKGA